MPLSTRRYLNKLNREVNRLQDQISPVEVKYLLDANSGFINDSSGATAALASIEPYPLFDSIVNGSANGERIGDDIKVQNITVRGSIKLDSTDPSSNCIVRSMFFKVPDNSTAVASTETTAWLNASNGSARPYMFDFVGPYNPKSLNSRYTTQVLSDKNYTFSYSGNRIIDLEQVIPINDIVRWDATNGTPFSGAVYHLVSSSITSTIPSLLPLLNVSYYTSFTDA